MIAKLGLSIAELSLSTMETVRLFSTMILSSERIGAGIPVEIRVCASGLELRGALVTPELPRERPVAWPWHAGSTVDSKVLSLA